jgi:hypothetical protein
MAKSIRAAADFGDDPIGQTAAIVGRRVAVFGDSSSRFIQIEGCKRLPLLIFRVAKVQFVSWCERLCNPN